LIELALDDVPKWLDSRLESAMRPLRKEWKSLLKDAEKALKDVQDACKKIKEEGEKYLSDKDHRKHGPGKAALRFYRLITGILDAVKMPSDISVSSMTAFQKDLARVYNTIGREWSGLLAKMDPYMIMARRKLKGAWRKIGSIVRDIDALVAKCKPLELKDEVSSAISKIEKLSSDLRALEGEVSALSIEREKIEEELSRLLEAKKELEKSEIMSRLEEARKLLENLRIEVRTEFRHAWKALVKLRAQSGLVALSQEERQALEAYLSDPLLALAGEEEGYPVLRSLLAKVGEAVDRGILALKPSKAEKLRRWLKGALSGSLTQLQSKCRKAVGDFESVKSSEEVKKALKELKALETRVSELEKKAGMLEARMSSLKAKQKSLKRKLEEELEALSGLLEEISGEEVRVVLRA